MVSHREIDLLGSAVINPHRISLRTLTVIFAVVFSLVSQYLEAQDNPPQSTLDGIFSQDQAKIGEKIFQVSWESDDRITNLESNLNQEGRTHCRLVQL